MSGIQRKIIVFAIALTFWGNVDAQTSTPNPNEPNGTMPCSVREPEYKKAADAAYQAFGDLVNITVNHSNMNNTPYMYIFTQSLDEFLNTSFVYCKPDGRITTENFKVYVEAVQFTLSNVTVLKDLQKDGAFECILNQKPGIDQCVEDKVSNNITSLKKYARLHAKSHLDFNNLACVDTEKVKPCILKVLEDNCSNAKEYVESIFDFILSKNCYNTPEINASVQITAHWSFFILTSFWTALALYIS